MHDMIRKCTSWKLSLAVLYCVIASGQSIVWKDSSPHRAQFITVEDGVQLEVLDWGGKGRPIVLLAGYLTAHVYDEFADGLKEIGHVYGITRRGLGASSHPESGYGAKRSAEDIVKVLDAPKLVAPVLVPSVARLKYNWADYRDRLGFGLSEFSGRLDTGSFRLRGKSAGSQSAPRRDPQASDSRYQLI